MKFQKNTETVDSFQCQILKCNFFWNIERQYHKAINSNTIFYKKISSFSKPKYLRKIKNNAQNIKKLNKMLMNALYV